MAGPWSRSFSCIFLEGEVSRRLEAQTGGGKEGRLASGKTHTRKERLGDTPTLLQTPGRRENQGKRERIDFLGAQSMKISTSERKGCFPASTEASGETALPAQHLPDLTQASTLMLQGADPPRPDSSWRWAGAGGCFTRAVTAPCSEPGFTAKKHQHKAVMQEIPGYKRQGSAKRKKTEPVPPGPSNLGLCALMQAGQGIRLSGPRPPQSMHVGVRLTTL